MTILKFKKKKETKEEEYKSNVWYRLGSAKAVFETLLKKDELTDNLKQFIRKWLAKEERYDKEGK
jgi:hypothetical protein|tara:strand:- start:301 stop:495 length:195 start_codon:yes stop_codon:yes gene_type:complete